MLSQLLIAARSLGWALLLLTSASISRGVEVEVLIGPDQHSPDAFAASDLIEPFGIEFDQSGQMVIVELSGGRILTWSVQAGLVQAAGTTEAGYVDGPAREARFNQLHNLVILPSGQILLSDHLNHAVRSYDPATKIVSTVAGTGKPGGAAASVRANDATFSQPICIAATPDQRHILIADIGNRVIRRFDLASNMITVIAGTGTRGAAVEGAIATESPLLDPRGAIENVDGEIYIIERNGHSLLRVDPTGRIQVVAGNGMAGHVDGGPHQSQLNAPKHLCFGPDGVVFIADDNNHAIRCYDPKTAELTTVDLGVYKLKRPHGVCVHQDWLYIADSYHHRVLRVRL
jgi:DNA-binding beta-propeller fold protein YncE